MSLLFKPNSARLSVIGNGWNNVSFDSGLGFVFDDELWKDIAFDLDYDFDMDMDFGELDLPEFDLSDIIFDLDGTIYTEIDGAWRDPLTGALYPGGGEMWMAENLWIKASNRLASKGKANGFLLRYNISQEIIDECFDRSIMATGWENYPMSPLSSRPGSPWSLTYVNVVSGSPVWVVEYVYPSYINEEEIKKNHSKCVFHTEPFELVGSKLTGGRKSQELADPFGNKYYWYSVSNTEEDYKLDVVYAVKDGKKYNADAFQTFPEEQQGTEHFPSNYIAAQCIYGSFEKQLRKSGKYIAIKDTTITTSQIKNGTSGLESREYGGKTYYKV